MKSRQSYLLISMVFSLTLVCGVTAFSRDGDMHMRGNVPDFVGTSFYTTDTVPKKAATVKPPKVTPPKIEVPKVAPPKTNNLFKKIAEAFKFRKHARESEKQRVLDIFETLGVNDSIAASSENIQLLIDELSVRENQHFDSLIAIINEIRLNSQRPQPVIDNKPTAKPVDHEAPAASSAKAVTDKDIEDLTNKLLPLIAEKANEDKADTEKREVLKELRMVKNNPERINVIVDTAKGIVKRFHLSVQNRAEVYGMHNYTSNNNYENYKLSQINTLIYQSLFINSKTGDVKEFNGWDKAQVISDAQHAGCKVVFTAAIGLPENILSFLGDFEKQRKFTENALYLLKMRKANGVNINFTGLPSIARERFSAFIKLLSETLKQKDPTYKVLVMLPAHDIRKAFDVAFLSQFTDRFIIDFTNLDSRSNGPIAPLKGKGDYTLETAVSRYLNTEVQPEKFVVSLPYSGVKWLITESGQAKFIQYLTYSEIRNRYEWPVYYDDESANAVMDSLNNKGMPIRSIWYDDDVALGSKYDFILGSGLGGVSINALGYDKGYGELWDMLAYKFSKVDTIYLKDSIITPLKTDLTFFERLSRKATLYWYILQNPCEICFEDIKDPESGARITRYLEELRIDSLRMRANEHRPSHKQFKSKFEYVNNELTLLLGFLTLFFLIVGLICGGIYVYEIKVKSDQWKWKKYAEIILIALAILFIIFFFAYLFTNDSIPLFGSSPAPVATQVPVVAVVESSTYVVIQDTTTTATVVSDAACITDPNNTCINMPLPTLMAIITAGMLVGLLLTRYLIMPLIKRNDIP